MSVEIVLDTPLAASLNAAIQPKLVEVGWSTGGADDSGLAEYIILMLVNGKTQDQIAAELSGDLLNLGPDDPGAREFSKWLFEQVEYLQQYGSLEPQANDVGNSLSHQEHAGAGQDAEMGDASGESNVYAISSFKHLQNKADGFGPTLLTHGSPTGPKSMRNGTDRNRDKRLFGHLGKAMDRSHDAVLHRVRPHGGNERINTHARGGPPTGPRSGVGRGNRPAMGRGTGMHGMPPSGPAGTGLAMTPQQQLEMFALLEQQSRMMAQMFTPQQQQQMLANGVQLPMANAAMGNGFKQQSGRSLFDRVQPNRGGHNGGPRKGPHANGNSSNNQNPPQSPMDVELTPVSEPPTADTTCKFNLSCTNKDCKFAHQSPAAPPGTAIDVTDHCAFGAACKNRKCTARHPSPAQKTAHQTEQECKFYPNCTNPRCPFKHPTMPLCRNGADCSTPNCAFTHVKTPCKFNPCLNPVCPFKHEEGQKRGKFDDKVWVAGEKEHVSERKFVDEEGTEELIKPGSGEGMTTELIT